MFFQSFKEMVATCLVKDPKKRPTSEKLFKHSFFKHARSNEYLARTILEGLTPLGDRFRTLKVSCSPSCAFPILWTLLEKWHTFVTTPLMRFVFQAKEADLLVQNKALYGDKEQLSQVYVLRFWNLSKKNYMYIVWLLLYDLVGCWSALHGNDGTT